MRKNATSTCGVLLALIAAAGAVQAQDSVSPERRQGPKDVPSLQGDATALGINLRFTDLNGDLDPGTSWNDLFNSGIGASIDLAFLNELDKGFHLGPYFQISGDLFQADENPTSGSIPVAEVDDLMVLRGMIGLNARITIGPIFFEARGGLGAVFYTATDIEFVAGTPVELFEGSVHFGWEGRATFGAMIGESSSLTISFGYETNDGPNSSDDLPGFSPKDLQSLVVSMGINFRL